MSLSSQSVLLTTWLRAVRLMISCGLASLVASMPLIIGTMTLSTVIQDITLPRSVTIGYYALVFPFFFYPLARHLGVRVEGDEP